MQLLILPDGTGRCVYEETLDLSSLGALQIQRGSHVEPDPTGRWCCDLSPVQGPVLGPFSTRSAALAAEKVWLAEHWLPATNQR